MGRLADRVFNSIQQMFVFKAQNTNKLFSIEKTKLGRKLYTDMWVLLYLL